MIDHSDKKLDYALRAIQHPQLRETDEFLQWIGIPENKELFLELMACKEAVIRENLQRKRKYRKKMRILAIASSVAAVLILAFLIPSLLPSTSLPAEQPIRFFAANNNDEHVVLQMDGRSEQQLLTDSVMDVKDWKKGECDLIPGKTAPHIIPVERDYPATYERFTSIGPLLETIGNGGKGIAWNTQSEMDLLRKLNYTKAEGPAKGQPKLETAIDAAEMILTLAPETNGQVAVKAWKALSEITGREHAHLALNKEDEKIRFRDIQAQPRKIISSPTWSGLEDEHVSYNAGYTNVHELIPWRTLSGRQSLYQDHQWMRDFGESLLVYRPPIDTRSVKAVMGEKSNGNPEKALNFLTPHQKWGIHSTYSDNLLMLTLSRGGPIVWMSEADAKDLSIEDNDWIEVFNANGALTARAVVSQRVPAGMTMMYHAQERIVNLPGSEITGQRGGIHNSVTRITPKPTHMIGGYGHLAYGFNYYGTVGSNRDEFVVVRKMKNINWLDGEGNDQVQESVK